MKRLKRAFLALAAVCMLVSGFSFSAYASSGQLRFSDPSTTVGAEVEVTATFTGTTSVQSMDATLTYDTSMLRFVSGSQVSDNNGTLTLSGAGDGTSKQLNFTMKFQALQEGTTVIQISSVSGTDTDGDAIDVTKGQSTVTIGPGDPSLIQNTASASGPEVEVNGTSYVISSDFSDALIPSGFEKTEMQFEGQTCTVVTQASSGATAMYLVPSDGGDGDLFLYNSDDGSFSPFEQIELSADRCLILLQKDGTENIPGGYQETTLTLNGKEFPAWQNTNNTDFYLVYGLNSDGNKVLYQYDTTDGTYQRYVKPLSISTEGSGKANGLLDSALQFIEDHLRWVMVAACILFALLIIVLIVTLVKLHHRNLELDDLYDEYGIDLEEEPEEEKAEQPDKKKRFGKKKKEIPEEIDLDDEPDKYEDDDFGYDEEYDIDEDDAYDFDEDDFDDEEEYDFADEEEDYTSFAETEKQPYGRTMRRGRQEEEIDDLDALLHARVREPEKRPEKAPVKRSHAEEDDTFKMDIIDLD